MVDEGVDVDVVAAITVASSRSVAVKSSICDKDVPAAIVACISRSIGSDADEAVCVAATAIISRSTSISATVVEVDVAMVATISRRIPINNSICDNDVVADIVAESSLSTPNDAIASVCVAHADTISRSTANSAALRDVVVVAVATSSLREIIPIEDKDVVAAIADTTSRRTFNSATVAAEVATVESISRRTSIAATDPVCVVRADVSSLNIFSSDGPVAAIVVMVVTSSRKVAVIKSICDNAVVMAIVVLNSIVAAPTPR